MKNTLNSSITVIVRDKDGNIKKQFTEKCESLLRQFQRFQFSFFASTTKNITDVGNTTRSCNNTEKNEANGPSGNDVYGIQIGTGTTTVAIDDYMIETQINEGTGAGQMEHQFTSITNNEGSSQDYVLISRQFINNSGSSITVKEAGLVTKTADPWYFLLLRDLITPTAVGDGESITIEYQLIFAL